MKTLLYGVLAYLVLLCFGVLAHANPHPARPDVKTMQVKP